MDDFNEGLGDILELPGTRFMHRLVWFVATTVFWLLSAATTFGFFAKYAAGLGNWLFPEMGWIIAGVQGIILLDSATFIWSFLSRNRGNTVEQIRIAQMASWATLAGALIVSFLFVLFSVSFNLGVYQADGSISLFGVAMEWVGSIIMTLAFVGNFLAAALYAFYSETAQKALYQAELSSIISAGRHSTNKARAIGTVQETQRRIQEQLPDKTRSAGQDNAEKYIDRHFGKPLPPPAELPPAAELPPPAELPPAAELPPPAELPPVALNSKGIDLGFLAGARKNGQGPSANK